MSTQEAVQDGKLDKAVKVFACHMSGTRTGNCISRARLWIVFKPPNRHNWRAGK